MIEFKVGDKVRCIIESEFPSFYSTVVGNIYEVFEVRPNDIVLTGLENEQGQLKNRFELVKKDTWKDRLLKETQDRAEQLNKLNTFMGSDAFLELDRENKDLLYWQSRTMTTLVQVLGKRLEYNGIEFKHKE